MGVKVYGPSVSTYTSLVLATLEELGVEYEQIPINFFSGEHKQPPHLLRQPFGQVPAFEDGDLTLFESRAISRYVARKFAAGGGVDLLREGNPSEAATVNVWVEVESQHFCPVASTIIFQTFVVPMRGSATDEAVVAKNAETLGKVFDVYEERLGKTKYLAGDFFSLADLHHLPFIFYLMLSPSAPLVAGRPRVMAWWEDLSSRPACKRVTDNMAAGIAAARATASIAAARATAAAGK